jgi:hypothetical protein
VTCVQLARDQLPLVQNWSSADDAVQFRAHVTDAREAVVV